MNRLIASERRATEALRRGWASDLGAEVDEMELESQFRCNGSDGYIAWLDHVLQIRETANTRLDELKEWPRSQCGAL